MTRFLSGRLGGGVDPAFVSYGSSLAEDRALVREDVVGSLAHVAGLRRARIVTDEEAATLAKGLAAVLARLEADEATLDATLEDVHMNVESLLGKEIGALAGKLHTGRSRNDQVALDLRLWTRRQALGLARANLALAHALLASAARHCETLAPGYTHLQPAQPIVLGHWFHAHALRALRDAVRAIGAFDAANAASPLGAGALAGTTLPLDPAYTADLLGFEGPLENSLDAVSDRDFALEALFASAVTATHLSGLCEELVLWSSPAYGFVSLPEPFTTGSSLMPQKANPDAAEIARSRAATALGDLVSALGVVKGLPLAYNRDLQELKAPLVRGVPAAIESAAILAGIVGGLAVDARRLAAAVSSELVATDLAEALVATGVPFREAHRRVGAAARQAQERGVPFAKVAEEAFGAHLEPAKLATLVDPSRSPSTRGHAGATAPKAVQAAIAAAAKRREALQAAHTARLARIDKAESRLLAAEVDAW